jgi:hypothetical protein
MAAQKTLDEDTFVADSIPATGAPGDMLVYIGQSWHTAGVNITPDRTRVALVGQWIPMYFRGDTELHDLDTGLLTRMSKTTLRCLGIDHRKGNNRQPRPLLESVKFASSTIGRALTGGSLPFSPDAADPVQDGPPLKLGVGLGALGCALAAHRFKPHAPLFVLFFALPPFPRLSSPALRGTALTGGGRSGNAAVRGMAGAGVLALGAWVGATSVSERARI